MNILFVGTHWTWEILNVLLTGKMNKKPTETAMLDFISSELIDGLHGYSTLTIQLNFYPKTPKRIKRPR